MKAVVVGVVVALCAALNLEAQAQVRSTIVGPGATKYPIAVSPLKTDGDPGLGVGFSDRVVLDLERSGMFRVLPRSTHIAQPQSSGVDLETIRFENWSVLGAHAVVKGTIAVVGEDVVVEARLFDVAQRSQLTGRRYGGRVEDIDRIADRFADEIIDSIAGERGPFDSKIAFLSTRDGRFKDLYVMSANGKDVERLTNARTINLAPRWGPQPDRLTMTSYRGGDPDLYTISYPGSRWQQLTRVPGLNLGGGFSPSGDSLVTTLSFDGNSEIGILDVDGTVRYRLTENSAIDVSPSWSPDGESIAFCSNRAGSPQIYVMHRSGSRVRRLTRKGSYNTSPAWSPKGDKVAYASRVRGKFQIFVIDTDGGGVHQVTTDGNNEDPSWSPDGRYLVYSATRRGRTHVVMSDLSGIHTVQLTEGNGGDTSPTWSGWLD